LPGQTFIEGVLLAAMPRIRDAYDGRKEGTWIDRRILFIYFRVLLLLRTLVL
jgi:hypothetical protein